MNGNGDIFGGWVLSQMDIAGGTLAARVAKGRVATVAITAMTFVQPIKVGDLVSIYGEVSKIGRTSITIALETVVQRRLDPTPIQVTHGTFVFVAIDDDGKPRPGAAMRSVGMKIAVAAAGDCSALLASARRRGASAYLDFSKSCGSSPRTAATRMSRSNGGSIPMPARSRFRDRRGQGRQVLREGDRPAGATT